MPRQDGVYTLPSGNPFQGGTVASSATVNATLDDIADAITDSLPLNGTAAATADLPMGTHKHTEVSNGTARNHYSAIGQLQDNSPLTLHTVGGTADAITANLSPPITAYVNGQRFTFKPTAANTGPATLAVNGLSALQIYKGTGSTPNITEVVAGDLGVGYPADLICNGTAWILQNPQTEAPGAVWATLVQNNAPFARTDAEITAGITPSNYAYPPYDARRYGVVDDDGVSDQTAALQRWLDASAGRVAYLPAGGYRITARLHVPNSTWIIGDGRENSVIFYTGATTITNGSMMHIGNNVVPPNPSASAFGLRGIGFTCTNLVTANETICLHMQNVCYFEVDNVKWDGSGSDVNENNMTGCLVEQTAAGGVPPPGAGVFRNCHYVVEPTTSGASLSRGIHIKGHASQFIEHIVFEGDGNLEHAYYAIHLENTSRVRIGSWQLRGATNTEIMIENSANTIVCGTQLAPRPTTGFGIFIDNLSTDTILLGLAPNFSSGAPDTYIQDNGVRTVIIAPGVVGGAPRQKIWGPQTITDTDDTTSNDATFEVHKNAAYLRNGLVVHTGTAPTGTKALFKGERGAQAVFLMSLDINGNPYLQVNASGDNLLAITAGAKVGFFGSVGTTRPTVSGSRGGNAALASLLTALAAMGLITDSSS